LEDTFFFLLCLGLTASFRVLPSLLCPPVRDLLIGEISVLISCGGSLGLVSLPESFRLIGTDGPAYYTAILMSGGTQAPLDHIHEQLTDTNL